ncbi:MAG: UDP-N-acetylmuramoyl-tripeptide--D-alanyl-D-alanine ligase, partial [Nitrospiraceae bacterium]
SDGPSGCEGKPLPLILAVPDPLRAYQQLAAYHRKRFSIPMVAVTGSNGKTTTKEMVARVLGERYRVLVTEGNLNNRIGVPQTLLGLTSRHEAAVIEMGVDQKGQTTRLAEITRPTIGIITNIGPDHLEFFGTLEASAQAKGELLDLLPPDSAAVLNADDPYFGYLASRARCQVLSFGFSERAEVRASDVTSNKKGTHFRLMLPGRTKPMPVVLSAYGHHNVSNALAAAAVGHLCHFNGTKIALGLSRFRPAMMRSQVEKIGGVRLINDCYNANPASMRAAIDVLADLGTGGRTIAVLGDMLELGRDSAALHHEVGGYVTERRVFSLIACGPLARNLAEGARAAGMSGDRIYEVGDAREAAAILASMIRVGDVVLVKGSRGMRMEQIVAVLYDRFAGRNVSRTTRRPRVLTKGSKH